MNIRQLLLGSVVSVGLAVGAMHQAQVAQAAPVIALPDPTTVLTVTYADFISYSLPVLNELLSTTAFDVSSAVGTRRSDSVFIGTGAGGAFPVNVAAGADAPLDFPNTPGSTLSNFSGTWSTPVSGLTSYLGGAGAAIMFNFNQTSPDQNILAFAQVILTGPGGAQTVFQLSLPQTINNPAAVFGFAAGAPLAAPANDDDFSMFGGDYSQFLTAYGNACVRAAPPDVIFDQAVCPAGYTHINQNLGANQAVFAIVSPELNAALYSGLYTDLTANIWLRNLTNGYEQAFIFADTSRQIPEPETIALFGAALGLLGLGLRRRRTAAN